MKAAGKRILTVVLVIVGLLMIGVVAGIIGSIDPDFFKGGLLQFFVALLVVVGFFIVLFLMVFVLIKGGHALISKDPIEKTLSDETVRKEMKETAKLTILFLLAEFCATKFRDWWNKKS